MSLQVHAWRASNSFSATLTQFISPIQGQFFNATELKGQSIVTAGGTFSNWQIVLPSAPTAGKSVVFTLRVNGVDTSAVITIANTSTVGTYTGAPISLADGDLVSIKSVPSGTPTISALHCSWSFNSTTANQSIYGAGNTLGTIGISRTSVLLFRPDISNWAVTTAEVVACPGTITKITIKLDVDTGASGSMMFTVTKNGTDQDGTSGTPDTRINFNNTGTTKSATFSLAVVAGDILTWKAVETGSANTITPIHGCTLTSTNPGESQYSGYNSLGLVTTTIYENIGNGCNGTTNPPDATEATWQANVGLTGFKLKNVYAVLNASPGATRSYSFNIRKNAGSTALQASIADAATSGNDLTGQVNLNPQDLVNLEIVPTNTPTSRVASISTVQFQSGQNAGGGNSNNGKKGGGGGLNILNPGGALYVQMGNTGIDVGITS